MRLTPIACTIRAAFFVALCLPVLASPAASQQPADEPTGRSIKATSVAVDVYAIVEGRGGGLIRGLTRDDFELTDNAIPQKITNFSQDTNAALSLGIAIDTSVSQGHLLSTEQQAAKMFLGSVLQSADRAFVLNFDVDVKLLSDFTNAPADLARAIDSAEINQTGRSVLPEEAARPKGGTHLYDAVYLASNELMKERVGRKVLVLVTDGEDQGSKINLQKSIESAERADVIVYSIVVSDPEFYSLMGGTYHGDSSIRKLDLETGGRTIRLKSITEIESAFDQIASELRAQYLLGYSPSNLRHDGSFRRIRVSVRRHNCRVRTRTGYYDHSK
ncbi:MAG TPA: VWA domain-containing protein [Candidatus Acidoferrales bacterium]|nr:VWA domain-containing protein [Candidatus Acidoferrales bacterium]